MPNHSSRNMQISKKFWTKSGQEQRLQLENFNEKLN